MLTLLGDGRIQVGTAAERGFRVGGIFELSLMHEPPRSNHASEGACVVAGGRSHRGESILGADGFSVEQPLAA